MADNKSVPAIPGASALKVGPSVFLKEAWVEVSKKTTWPTRSELVRSTSIVLGAIVAISLYLAAWDLVMTKVTEYVFLRR